MESNITANTLTLGILFATLAFGQISSSEIPRFASPLESDNIYYMDNCSNTATTVSSTEEIEYQALVNFTQSIVDNTEVMDGYIADFINDHFLELI